MSVRRARPVRTHPRSEATTASVLAGLLLGACAVAVVEAPGGLRPMIAGAAVVALIAIIAGDARRTLLGILLVEFPLQLDTYLNFDDAASAHGAFAGFNLSLTSAAIGGLWLMRLLGRGERLAAPASRQVFAVALPLGLYIAAVLISLPVARSPQLALFEIALLVQTFLVFLYLATSLRERSDVLFVVGALLAGVALQGVIAQLFVVGIDPISIGGDRWQASADNWREGGLLTGDGPARFAGTLSSPNTQAGFLGLALVPALALLASPLRGPVRGLAIVSFGLGAVALVMTFSRGGWIAFGVALGVFLALGARRRWLSQRTLATLVLTAVVLGAVFASAISSRLGGDDGGAAGSRVGLVATASRIAEDHLVRGVGANNYSVVLPDYRTPDLADTWNNTVHNKYLLVLTETGALGLIAFVCFLLAVIRAGIRGSRARDPVLAYLALGLTAAVIGHMAHMGVENFHNRPATQGLWIVAAVIVAIAGMAATEHAEEIPEPAGPLDAARPGGLHGDTRPLTISNARSASARRPGE